MNQQQSHKSECNGCIRCRGLLVVDYFYSICGWLKGIRCVNCGWVKMAGVK
jgi:hypothetical protein